MIRLSILLLGMAVWGCVSFAEINYVGFKPEEISLLVNSLKNEGLSKAELEDFFSKPQVQKIPEMVAVNVTKQPPLKASVYAKFAEAPALGRAREFLRLNLAALKSAEATYQVDAEAIVAIALVETNLGTFTGNYPLMAIYPSVFVDSSHLLTEGKVKSGQAIYEKVVRKKGWALEQLKALIKMKKKYNMDVYALKGSYAGAIGICQFLPSSYLSYAVSTNQGIPDLYQPPDAIHSIGRYLKAHGYKLGVTNPENRKAVYGYNHSQVYVDIVLKIAQRLKETAEAH